MKVHFLDEQPNQMERKKAACFLVDEEPVKAPIRDFTEKLPSFSFFRVPVSFSFSVTGVQRLEMV